MPYFARFLIISCLHISVKVFFCNFSLFFKVFTIYHGELQGTFFLYNVSLNKAWWTLHCFLLHMLL